MKYKDESNCTINLSISEVVEIYNRLPQVLSRKAVKISIIEERLVFGSRGIAFCSDGKGSYWAIATEDGKFWLFPKGNLRINSFNLKTVKSLFDCRGLEGEESREFAIVEPGRVSPTPDGSNWELVKRGILDFSESSPLSQARSELEGLKEERELLRLHLMEVSQERDRYQSQVAELAYKRFQEMEARLVGRDEFQRLIQRVDRLERTESDRKQLQFIKEEEFKKLEKERSAKLHNLETRLQNVEQNNRFSFICFIETYNQNPKSLSRNATEVAETEESIKNRRLGSNQPAILEKSRRGTSWIIEEGGHQYMVPKANLKINEHAYKSIQALFDCHGYGPGSSFQVVEPAIVYPISSGQTWQIQKRSVLQFY